MPSCSAASLDVIGFVLNGRSSKGEFTSEPPKKGTAAWTKIREARKAAKRLVKKAQNLPHCEMKKIVEKKTDRIEKERIEIRRKKGKQIKSLDKAIDQENLLDDERIHSGSICEHPKDLSQLIQEGQEPEQLNREIEPFKLETPVSFYRDGHVSKRKRSHHGNEEKKKKRKRIRKNLADRSKENEEAEKASKENDQLYQSEEHEDVTLKKRSDKSGNLVAEKKTSLKANQVIKDVESMAALVGCINSPSNPSFDGDLYEHVY